MNTCVAICFLCWGAAGLCFAFAKLKEAQHWKTLNKTTVVDDDDDDNNSNGGDQPVTPYDIDPQFDPSDWWKHEPKERERA